MACENPFVCFESVQQESGVPRSVLAPAPADSVARAQSAQIPKTENKNKKGKKAGKENGSGDFECIEDLPKGSRSSGAR